jgi:hypothetical protein
MDRRHPGWIRIQTKARIERNDACRRQQRGVHLQIAGQSLGQSSLEFGIRFWLERHGPA